MLLAEALGNLPLALDARFLTNPLRVQNRPALVAEIEKCLARKPIQHWIDVLNEAGVPCAPINTIDKLFDHPQLLARNMIVQVQGQNGKPFKTAGNPIKLTGHEEINIDVPMNAPGLGQHREAVLAELMASRGSYEQPTSNIADSEDQNTSAA
jgi:CoA:oxalate CoA-transferase